MIIYKIYSDGEFNIINIIRAPIVITIILIVKNYIKLLGLTIEDII